MKLYISNSCPACSMVTQSPLFARVKHIVQIKNVSVDPYAAQELTMSGYRTVPTLIDGSAIFNGAQEILKHFSS